MMSIRYQKLEAVVWSVFRGVIHIEDTCGE
jgi:hypothetical protein